VLDRLRWLVVNGMQRLCLVLGGIQGRGWRRGEQIVVGRSWDPIVLGEDGERDVSIGFDEIVNR
jgi:hypothetical protein